MSGSPLSIEPPRVVLLHGLHRTRYSMLRVERRLSREGFRTLKVGYRSTRFPIEQLAEHVERKLVRSFGADPAPIHFVTHSMGGIIVRALATRPTAPKIGRVVMLAPPNHGSEIVDRLEEIPFLRSLWSPARRQLRTGSAGLPERLGPARFETGIIAGTRQGISPFRRWVRSPSDGMVSVVSARLDGMSDFVTVPRAHPFLMNDAAVMDLIVLFLRTGRFGRSSTSRDATT